MNRLRLGMVGGGKGAFIGAVHRMAARLDDRYELVAGAFSSSPERARASGQELGIADSRNYGTWEEMLEAELKLPEGERIDAVSIVTPNHMHYPVALAFAGSGFNVICDKPLVHTSSQARDLIRVVRETGIVFGVTYNYTGYPMVQQARELVQTGQLGKVRKVLVEYNQGWLAQGLEESGDKQASWRTDPARSGIGGAVGDIGTHAENLMHTITGLELSELCADVTTFVPGRRLDDDASMLLRFSGGARGVLTATQIAVGQENALSIRVYGERGAIAWHQENPNELSFSRDGEPEMIWRRGNGYLGQAAATGTRLPSGHPEAFIEAFANVYSAVAAAIHRSRGVESGAVPGYPDVTDGARGVHFVEKVIDSGNRGGVWVDAAWQAD